MSKSPRYPRPDRAAVQALRDDAAKGEAQAGPRGDHYYRGIVLACEWILDVGSAPLEPDDVDVTVVDEHSVKAVDDYAEALVTGLAGPAPEHVPSTGWLNGVGMALHWIRGEAPEPPRVFLR